MVHRPPRSGVSPERTLIRGEKLVTIEVGTGCTREGAGRMPDQENPAQGNPNSMPQILASSKFLINASAKAVGTVSDTVGTSNAQAASRAWHRRSFSIASNHC